MNVEKVSEKLLDDPLTVNQSFTQSVGKTPTVLKEGSASQTNSGKDFVAMMFAELQNPMSILMRILEHAYVW